MSEVLSSVLDELGRANFESVPQPMSLGGVEFEFSAVFSGYRSSLDLIVVHDGEQSRWLMTQMDALARALDFVGSRRSLTLVWIGRELPTAVRSSLLDVCRVLTISDRRADVGEVRRSLSVLLPLHVPGISESSIDPLEELIGRLSTTSIRRLKGSGLLDAGVHEDEPRLLLRRWLTEPLSEEAPA